MKWLIRFLMKSAISAAQRAVVLCRKLSKAIQTAIDAIKLIPGPDVSGIVANLETVKAGVAAVEAVLIKILEKVGAEIPSEDGAVGTVANEIEEVKKLL